VKDGAVLNGIAVSSGITCGTVLIIEETKFTIARSSIDPQESENEIDRLKRAIQEATRQVEILIENFERDGEVSKKAIFEAHLMMLSDPALSDTAGKKINEENLSAEEAVHQTISEFCTLMEGVEDSYLRERAADFKDIGQRIFRNLQGYKKEMPLLTQPRIIIAKDLTPSETAQLDKSKVLALATEQGGKTSHTAIIAKALGLPAVVGVAGLMSTVKNGDFVVIDGAQGIVVVNPGKEVLKQYEKRALLFAEQQAALNEVKNLSCCTVDGQFFEIGANIGSAQDVEFALSCGAEGIGLFRTEFLYLHRDDPPGEQEQFEIYKRVAEGMKGKPVVIRTLDIGGDKTIPFIPMGKEMNPFLGVRGIRLCLRNPELFRTQLRAIIRASAYGNIRVMFPMIAILDEFIDGKKIVRQIQYEFKEEGIAYNPNMQIGIMVEVPSAAAGADLFAKHVDFFSIGTNDLVQYTMAADRLNETLNDIADYFNPVILRLINQVAAAAHAENKWVGMCGEMAGDHRASEVLLGLGLNEFSMSASCIPIVKNVLVKSSKVEARKVAEQVITFGTSKEVLEYLNRNGIK
jgi:phosphoenolpyruvate-protein phosphotransferase